MRTPTRFGICGLAACVGSFCLSTATGLPQEAVPNNPAAPIANEDSPLPAAALPSLRQLQEQNLAVLKALEHLGEERDVALHRYTETITTQLNALKDAFAVQREHELQAARSSNRIILTVAAVSAGLAVLMMIFSAFLPIWALKRFAAARMAPRIGALFLPQRFNIWGGPALPPLHLSPGGSVNAPLSGAMAHLEERLLALEKRASQPRAGSRDEASPSQGHVEPISPGPRKPESSIAKYSKAAHVAITLGAGEAIGFLPRETGLIRLHSFRAFLGKLKRIFQRPRTG